MTAQWTEPVFDHILRMTDGHGTFEHARMAIPRSEGGYCVDDVARVLVVASREDNPSPQVCSLAGAALQFLAAAQTKASACHNRMDSTGRWTDQPSVEDCWGRSIWALGTAAAQNTVTWIRRAALTKFEHAAALRSTWPRSMAYAALGAAEVLSFAPENRAACRLLTYYAASAPKRSGVPAWPWPEPRFAMQTQCFPRR